MWISRKRIVALEKRIADLEKSQLSSAEMVRNYILDLETMSNKLNKEIELLPIKIQETLRQYSLHK